jgi:hypothetical protein
MSSEQRMEGDAIVVALTEYRARTGAYPTELSELVPGYLDAKPAELGNFVAPFQYFYERQGDGYRLESIDGSLTCSHMSNDPATHWTCIDAL